MSSRIRTGNFYLARILPVITVFQVKQLGYPCFFCFFFCPLLYFYFCWEFQPVRCLRFFRFSFLALRLPFLGLPVSTGALEGTISRRLVASNRSLLKSVPVLPSPAGPRLGFESKSSSKRRTCSSRRSEKGVENF